MDFDASSGVKELILFGAWLKAVKNDKKRTVVVKSIFIL
jgi:hypothetical protein